MSVPLQQPQPVPIAAVARFNRLLAWLTKRSSGSSDRGILVTK